MIEVTLKLQAEAQQRRITHEAHHQRVTLRVPVLGAEYIGTVAKGNHVEWFEAGTCPDGLDQWACLALTQKGEGIHKGAYHWQAWVLQVKCPYCKASGFKTLESRRPRQRVGGPPCIVCGKCGMTLDTYREDTPEGNRGNKNWNKEETK